MDGVIDDTSHNTGFDGLPRVFKLERGGGLWLYGDWVLPGGKRDIPAEKMVLKKLAPDEMRLIKKVIKKRVRRLKPRQRRVRKLR